ncbi:MAG: nucleotidyltransferase domain-containing protein [Nanoarchaeota archaeon]
MKQKPIKNTRYLTKEGKVTSLLKQHLEEVLQAHIDASTFWAGKRNKPREDYTVREAYIVGSILRGNDESDLDILLIGNKLDQEDYRFLKQVLAQSFFVNRAKTVAVDVFTRPYDEFPEKPSFEITSQVRHLLDTYNRKLTSELNY